MRAWFVGSLVLLAAAPFSPVSAQSVPKAGPEYVDSNNLGFRIKMPEGWTFVPPQPNEDNSVGKYTVGETGLLRDAKTGRPVFQIDVQILKFDRRPKPEDKGGDADKKIFRTAYTDFASLIAKYPGDWKQEEKKELVVNKVPAVRYVYGGEIDGVQVRFLAYEYKLQPDIDVAAIFPGPGEDKKWSKFEGAYDSMAKSFKPVAVAAKTAGPTGTSMREQKQFELEEMCKSTPGWQLYVTPNYFIISSKNDDKPFLDELQTRLEAIREAYEKLYPAAQAIEWRQTAKAKKAATAPPPGNPQEPNSPEGSTESAKPVDPMEASRCSIVRVCKDAEQYHSYGGPGGSAGYWSSYDKELVIYDDQKGGGRRDTWNTLNHEAFHQYIYYFFGELAPHSWYNEGTGDFFSGYQLDHKKFVLKPNDWRQRLVQVNLNQGKYVPWKDMVRFTQGQYYSTSSFGTDIGDHYAQGWSMIYFLRTGKKTAKGWNPAWDSILDTYLRTLAETDDLDQAVDKAFAGVDWDEIEKCWKDYITHNS